jgi:hypothetical protein
VTVPDASSMRPALAPAWRARSRPGAAACGQSPNPGKDCGLGRFPSYDFGINTAWLAASLTAATLLSWLRLIALDGDLARAEPKALRPAAARRRKARPQRTPAAAAENPRNELLSSSAVVSGQPSVRMNHQG